MTADAVFLCMLLLGLCLRLLQYLVLLSKRFDDEKQRQQLYRSRVRQTEVLMLLLHTLCSGAAFLLPCIVIHLTQVGGRVLLGTCGVLRVCLALVVSCGCLYLYHPPACTNCPGRCSKAINT